jgi:large subunit ribosomal protein L16
MRKIILQPKKTKFKKQHKGILTPIEWKISSYRISYGIYGIQVLKSLRITLKQLETARRQISKHLRKSETFWFRIIPDIPVSKKPNEIRMGKGKGAVDFWASRIKAGQTFIEFSLVTPKKAKQVFQAVSKKLPVPCILLKSLKKISTNNSFPFPKKNIHPLISYWVQQNPKR